MMSVWLVLKNSIGVVSPTIMPRIVEIVVLDLKAKGYKVDKLRVVANVPTTSMYSM